MRDSTSIAQAMDKHDTVGLDLVAMCVDAAAAAGASVWPESLAFDAGAADAANVPCSPIPS